MPAVYGAHNSHFLCVGTHERAGDSAFFFAVLFGRAVYGRGKFVSARRQKERGERHRQKTADFFQHIISPLHELSFRYDAESQLRFHAARRNAADRLHATVAEDAEGHFLRGS